MQLLGMPLESAVGLSYTKHSKHSLVTRDNRCLLRVPRKNFCVSPEELLAHVLREIVRLARTRCKRAFSSAMLMLDSTELRSQNRTRAHAEAAALADLHNITFVSRAAAKVNHILREYAWCLQPKAGHVPFIVVNYYLLHADISLVTADVRVTSVEALIQARSYEVKGVFGRTVEDLLQYLEPFGDCQSLGLLICDSSALNNDETSALNDDDRSEILSSLREILDKRFSQLRVRVIEDRGLAYRGTFYPCEGNTMESGIVGKSGYAVEMAVGSRLGGLQDFVRLWEPTATLPCRGTALLLPLSSRQHGFLLRFFAVNNIPDESGHLLMEMAIKFPKNTQGGTFSLAGSMTSSHNMLFRLFANNCRTLASVHYSVDGIVNIDCESMVAITPTIRLQWLPKSAFQSGPNLPSLQDGDPTPSPHVHKRARGE